MPEDASAGRPTAKRTTRVAYSPIAVTFPPEVVTAVRKLSQKCLQHKVRIVFAETCTGGLISAAMTAVAGASRVVDRGFVVYSHDSTERELGVSRDLSVRFGAVSEQVAIAMAQGALRRAAGHAQISVATTGVAGPIDTPAKPVGLTHIAVARLGNTEIIHEKYEFGSSERERVRTLTLLAALDLAARALDR